MPDGTPTREVSPAPPERRYRYSLGLYIGQIAIATALTSILGWALIESRHDAWEVPGAVVSLAIAWVFWLGIREVYRSPREIVVAGDRVRIVTFSGRHEIFFLRSLRHSGKRNNVYGSFDIFQADGRLAFRLYVWLARYKELLGLMPANQE